MVTACVSCQINLPRSLLLQLILYTRKQKANIFLVTLFIFASVLFYKLPSHEITPSIKGLTVKFVQEASYADSPRFPPTSGKDFRDSGKWARVLGDITHTPQVS